MPLEKLMFRCPIWQSAVGFSNVFNKHSENLTATFKVFVRYKKWKDLYLNRTFNLHHFKYFNLVTDFHIVVVFHADTAFHAVTHFGNVVFKAA